MAISLSSEIKYIPELGGERKRVEAGEEKNPVTFHIKVMGATAFRQFASRLSALSKEGGEFTPEMQEFCREVFARHVPCIENLFVDGVPVKDGKAFFDNKAIPHALVQEVEKALFDANMLSEGDRKN